jgi:alkylation response protein AidB-like acyl-CoA dehydrogenase
MTVVKDSGARAALPPFGEEHEELRETVSRFVAKEIAPHVDEWEARGNSRVSSTAAAPSSASSG